ncbi:hypothetical protein X927_02780 [Petrotoga mexicana DSM 14811]|uniref:Uncharacterized protein n=1 Tax=Petrotoga mexicana DSM 14811 TaxID=1122954 RepID=A0A2K1PD92_9BACT|nr:hypothetical protein X927_02780 [Petrotoga mexicana DSM 14811]
MKPYHTFPYGWERAKGQSLLLFLMGGLRGEGALNKVSKDNNI